MSGGSFNYAFAHFNDFSEMLENFIDAEQQYQAVKNPGPDDYTGMGLSQLQMNALMEFAQHVRAVSEVARQIEWAVSGDTGIEEMMRALGQFNGFDSAKFSLEASGVGLFIRSAEIK